MPEQTSRDICSRKLIGMPVYSCKEGLYLGNIRNILIDNKGYIIEAFLLGKRMMGKDERILPFEAVYNFGKDGVTVETAASVERKGQSSRFIRTIRHPVHIIGSRVFTTGGRTLGKVEEYRFDSNTGHISGLEIAPDGFFKVRSLVKGEHIIAISEHTVMLKDTATEDAIPIENAFINNMGNMAETVKEKAGEFISNTADFTKKISASIGNRLEKPLPEENEDSEASDLPSSSTSNQDTASNNADNNNTTSPVIADNTPIQLQENYANVDITDDKQRNSAEIEQPGANIKQQD